MSACLQPRLEFLPMSSHDLDEVMAIEQRIYPFPWSRGNFADSMKAGYTCWTCRQDTHLVGYCVVMMSLDEAHLLNISIDSAMHGQGFGARLLRHAMRQAALVGGRSMLLEVRPSNEQGLRLYRHFGFAEIGRRKAYYPAHDGREDALVFRRDFDETTA